MNELHPAQHDVAVLLIFFCRVETFQQVFHEVKKARPARLLLYQDGPRSDKDKPGIEACRRIAEDIDWQCEVHRFYQERNVGCDPSGFIAHRWAFSLVDKCIVLEDDVVPSQAFFPFCKEMLDRYEHDDRIGMVAGFNIDEETPDMPYSYFFSSAFSIWGWASWRRVVEKWDEHYSFLDGGKTERQLEQLIAERRLRRCTMRTFRGHAATGKAYFETIFQAALLLQSQLAIMPRRNLINNVGFSGESTHFQSSTLDTMPHQLRYIFTMDRHQLAFPLQHPPYVMEQADYRKRMYKVYAWDHPFVKVCYSLEELWLNFCRGNFKTIAKAVRQRVRKWMHV